MREVKFRAWDTQAGCMLGGGGMQMNATTGKLDHLPSVVIMQYTGLKDKEGKEIFEGDLIKDSDSKCVGEVIFDNETLCFTTRFKDNDLWGFVPQHGKDNHCKVVGNIWENPELLEGKP